MPAREQTKLDSGISQVSSAQMNRSVTRFSTMGSLSLARCRVCGSSNILKRGEVEFYFGYAWPIYDCDDCGCRFTGHDSSAYDLLYSEQSSCYSRYTAQAETCRRLFDRGDRAALRALLSKSSKYRFIIDAMDREPAKARILEIGSSRGHLTSYFILAGRKIAGVDVSPNAIATAKANFGDYFVQAGDPSIGARAPYDVIFHVGTIGCAADPVGLTRQWLDLLKPGGQLLFNAPNRDGCALRDQLWFESAPPPDVVTLFPPGFWRDRFGDAAVVSEKIEFCSPEQNLLIALRKSARRRWRKPVPLALKNSERWSAPVPTLGDALWLNLERLVRKAVGLHRLAPLHPSEYGLFIQMVKK
jgi:SAM-dependent methyltransferase